MPANSRWDLIRGLKGQMEFASTLSGICKHLEWSMLTPWILLPHMTLSEATETGLSPKCTIGPGF